MSIDHDSRRDGWYCAEHGGWYDHNGVIVDDHEDDEPPYEPPAGTIATTTVVAAAGTFAITVARYIAEFCLYLVDRGSNPTCRRCRSSSAPPPPAGSPSVR